MLTIERLSEKWGFVKVPVPWGGVRECSQCGNKSVIYVEDLVPDLHDSDSVYWRCAVLISVNGIIDVC